MYRSPMLQLEGAILLLCGILLTIVGAKSPICCFPNQFESFMFAAVSQKDDSTQHTGGTYTPEVGIIRTAYDVTDKRTYMFASFINAGSDDPGKAYLNITFILDYKKKVSYSVFGDVCYQGPNNDELFLECIPEDAEVVGNGLFGDSSTQIVSYLLNVTIQNLGLQTVVSVINTEQTRGECIPVRMSLTNNPLDNVATALVTDVVDVTRGIKDTSIFKPPPNCIRRSYTAPLSLILKTLK